MKTGITICIPPTVYNYTKELYKRIIFLMCEQHINGKADYRKQDYREHGRFALFKTVRPFTDGRVVRARAHYERSLSLAEQIHHDVLILLSFEMNENTRKVVIHTLRVPHAYFHVQRQDKQAAGWRKIISWQLFPRRLSANLAGEALFSSRGYLANGE